MKTNIGMIGLAVMGENLARNIESKGFSVSVYDIDEIRVEDFIKANKENEFYGFNNISEFIKSIEKPRKVMMMIRAGKPVDSVINLILPLLDAGDIIIDGGNTYFEDTIRRTKLVEEAGCLFIGTGVSGGEEGALKGPSIMPGGSKKAWKHVKPIFEAISAKTKSGDNCVDWVGNDGAGHYVKMVHNGIEYGDIQLITEVYQIMRDMLNMTADEIGDVFTEWNKGELDSYLVEITSVILKVKDEDGLPLIDKILDVAGQKGTGKWTTVEALAQGVPLSIIGEAVFARYLSSIKEERIAASVLYKSEIKEFTGDKKAFLEELKNALYVSKIMSYAQGFSLLKKASEQNKWDLDFGSISLLWRGGCIIRSVFLVDIKKAFKKDPTLDNLLVDSFFKNEVLNKVSGLRKVVSASVLNGVSVPTLSMSIAYFDGYTTERLPANLLQAQRDFFGAHTYERIDDKRGKFFHTNWTGKGGSTASTTYDA